MQTVNVIVETPKGSSEKYDFDPKTGYMKLNKIMPVGMVFPFDFGFIPGTLGEDGDPLDVIVISEIKTFPGCAIDCRIVGAIKANQKEEDGKIMRNDRFIAIPVVSTLYADVKSLKNLSDQIIEEIEQFFTNYNVQAGKSFKPQKHIPAKEAIAVIKKAKDQNIVKTKLIQLFIPINNSKGKPFPKSYFNGITKLLTTKFDGLTSYFHSPVLGKWKEDNTKIVQDKLIVYEVMADEIDREFWERYKEQLEIKFKQKEILLRGVDINLI